MIENIVPILRVEDLAASKRFYVDTLGFKLDWEAPGMISVSRDGCAIMLCEGHQGQKGTWLWVGVDGVDALHAAFAARGASIRDAPQNFAWAYEFQVEDPDGHVLRFGGEPRADLPLGRFKA
jgi:catechol 2,3-dioxygenase-like lactoylglutathione lyase family enzyme